jgi:hypothetical protein
LAKAANDNGDYFPVYVVCNGMEMLGIIISEDVNSLGSKFNDPGVTHELFETPFSNSSRFFSKLDPSLYEKMFSDKLSYFHHKHAFDFDTFASNQKLMDFFDVLSINTD